MDTPEEGDTHTHTHTCTHAHTHTYAHTHTHTHTHTRTHTVSEFDTADHFQTTPEMATHIYNRLTAEQLAKGGVVGSKVNAQVLNNECASQYKELNSRIQRHKQLKQVTQKMKTQKDLMVSIYYLWWCGVCMLVERVHSCRAKVIALRCQEMVLTLLLTSGRRSARNDCSHSSIYL